MLDGEAAEYEEMLARRAPPTGKEPALAGLLLLPQRGDGPLPAYSQQADFLPPEHCRLCLAHDFQSEASPHTTTAASAEQGAVASTEAPQDQSCSCRVNRTVAEWYNTCMGTCVFGDHF